MGLPGGEPGSRVGGRGQGREVLKGIICLRPQEGEQVSATGLLSGLWVWGPALAALGSTGRRVSESGKPMRGCDGACQDPQRTQFLPTAAGGPPWVHMCRPSLPGVHLPLLPSVPSRRTAPLPPWSQTLGCPEPNHCPVPWTAACRAFPVQGCCSRLTQGRGRPLTLGASPQHPCCPSDARHVPISGPLHPQSHFPHHLLPRRRPHNLCSLHRPLPHPHPTLELGPSLTTAHLLHWSDAHPSPSGVFSSGAPPSPTAGPVSN